MKILTETLTNPQQGLTYTSGLTTSGIGIGTILEYIPDVLGVIATVVGITVTILLWLKQRKKLNLEIEVLKKQL